MLIIRFGWLRVGWLYVAVFAWVLVLFWICFGLFGFVDIGFVVVGDFGLIVVFRFVLVVLS